MGLKLLISLDLNIIFENIWDTVSAQVKKKTNIFLVVFGYFFKLMLAFFH